MGRRAGIRRAGVAASAVAMVALALGGAAAPAGAGSGRTVVTADDFDFGPKRVTVQVGTKVVWKQVEGEHTVTKGSFEKLFENDKVTRVFTKPGGWRYYCRFHLDERMKGKIVVE